MSKGMRASPLFPQGMGSLGNFGYGAFDEGVDTEPGHGLAPDVTEEGSVP